MPDASGQIPGVCATRPPSPAPVCRATKTYQPACALSYLEWRAGVSTHASFSHGCRQRFSIARVYRPARQHNAQIRTIHRWWWWWCGHDVTRRCLPICAHACIKLKLVGASAPTPSAGLSSQHPSKPFPYGGRLQAYPVQASPTPKPRKKIARFAPLSPWLTRARAAIFFIASALDALDPEHHELEYWGVSSWLARLVSQSYFHNPEKVRSNSIPLTKPSTRHG